MRAFVIILEALAFLAITIFLGTIAQAQVKDVITGYYATGIETTTNYIANPDCFANTRNISTSDTGAVARETSDQLRGVASCSLAATSAGGKVRFALRTEELILKNKDCALSFSYMGAGADWKVYVERDGQKVTPELNLEAATTAPDNKAIPIFPCGDLSNPTEVVFEGLSTASGELILADLKYSLTDGRVSRFGNLQAIATGKVSTPLTASCLWSVTGSTSMTAFSADSDCPTATVTGAVALPPSTKIPAFRLKPSGSTVFDVVMTGAFELSRATTATINCAYELYDGTNSYPLGRPSVDVSGGATNAFTVPALAGRIALAAPLTAITTFQLRVQPNQTTTSCSIRADLSPFEIAITAHPAESTSHFIYDLCRDPRSCVPDFSFRGNSSAAVTGDDTGAGFVESTGAITSTSLFTYDFDYSFISVPTCTCSIESTSTSAGRHCVVNSISTSQVAVFTYRSDSSGNFSAGTEAHHVACKKTGVDLENSRLKFILAQLAEYSKTPGRNNEKVYKANITCGSSSAVNSQRGTTWLSSVGNISSNRCAITFSGSPFSSANFDCRAVLSGNSANMVSTHFTSKTTSGVSMMCRIDPGGSSGISDCSAAEFDLTCEGN